MKSHIKSKNEVALKNQRSKSIAIACILFFLVAVFFLTTVIRIGSNITERIL